MGRGADLPPSLGYGFVRNLSDSPVARGEGFKILNLKVFVFFRFP